jgi:hypothetical protein
MRCLILWVTPREESSRTLCLFRFGFGPSKTSTSISSAFLFPFLFVAFASWVLSKEAILQVGRKNEPVGVIEEVAITSASTKMNVECSACHLDADFLSQGSGTPILYLTRCGHICCDMCRTNWFASGKETCPKCRQPQTRANLIRIYYDVAQRAQPSTTTVVGLEGPEADLQVSSERFLEVVADPATDIFGACVTLASTSPSRPSRSDSLTTSGHAILCRGWWSKSYQAVFP